MQRVGKSYVESKPNGVGKMHLENGLRKLDTISLIKELKMLSLDMISVCIDVGK